jgi:O-antigen/teichoic acid export membrane protein
MELKLLIKNTSFLAGTTFIKFLAGIFRSKLNAIYLGTEGVGIVSQFLMMINTATDFTTLGMNEAVVKQIAQSANDEEANLNISSSIKTYLITISFFIGIGMSILILFQDEITLYVFGNGKFIRIFYLAIITFPLLILNGVFFAILKGFKGIKHIAIARTGIIVSNLLIFVPLIIIYKLKGAIIYLPISFLITMIWNLYFANRFYLKPNGLSFKNILKAPIRSDFRSEMLIFSGFGLIVSILSILSSFIGRSLVVTNFGIDKIGIYSPIITWAGLFTGFLLPSFNTYLFPRFSEVKTNKEATGIINDALRLATLCLLPLLLLAIPYRDFMIRLFYSSDFLEASNYLPYHFIGVVFNVWFVVFGQTMTPRGFIKQHTIFKSIFFSISLGLAFLLVPLYGLNGWMLKFIISYVFLFFVNYIFLVKKTDFIIYKSNLGLMIYILGTSAFLVLIEKVLNNIVPSMILGPVFLLLTYFLLSTNEKNFLRNKLKFLKR